jgi:hypothetical protein
MNEEDDEILSEIRRVREDMARESGYNVHVMFEKLRQTTERLRAEGWKVVDFSNQPSEEPPA